MASYDNPGGKGNRRFPILITTTASMGGGHVREIISGFRSNAVWFIAGQSGREVVFDFRTPRIIDEATWFQDNASTHGTWKWQGSNNGSTWTDIGSTFTLGGTAQVHSTLNGNTTAYRYYRLLQTAGTTSSSPYTREIEFRIDELSPTLPSSYFYPGGQGDRRSLITLTTTANTGGPNLFTEFISGLWEDRTYFVSGQSGREVRFQFPGPRVITEATWVQNNTSTHGTWKWQGSNDGSNWTDIGGTFTLGGDPFTRHTSLHANETAYTYYRLLQVSGLTADPWLREIGFSISPPPPPPTSKPDTPTLTATPGAGFVLLQGSLYSHPEDKPHTATEIDFAGTIIELGPVTSHIVDGLDPETLYGPIRIRYKAEED